MCSLLVVVEPLVTTAAASLPRRNDEGPVGLNVRSWSDERLYVRSAWDDAPARRTRARTARAGTRGTPRTAPRRPRVPCGAGTSGTRGGAAPSRRVRRARGPAPRRRSLRRACTPAGG